MTPIPANAQLAELLRAHGLSIQEEGEWLRVGSQGPRFYAAFIDTRTGPGHCMRQLDVWLGPWAGQWVVESVGGVGKTEEEASRDALANFVRASLHVLLSAFVRPPDAHVTIETWQVGGIDRKVILGDIVSRGDDAGPKHEEPWLRAFEDALKSLPLTSGTHWVRVYYAQMDGERMTLEVLLDNEPWQALTDLLETASWPAAPGFLSRRLFLVLQGGADASRAVATWLDCPDDGDPVALIQEQGATLLEAEKLYAYIPLAFGESVMKRLGAVSPVSAEFTADPPTVQGTVVLAEDPLWRALVQLAEEAFEGKTSLTREQLLHLSGSSSTVRVLNELMNKGGKPEDLRFTPPLIIISPEAMAEWPAATPAAPRRP
ncbi:DUF6348 family protein [Corallococcus aberystwythensis]|uniref:Uncharacterized protein n=1 Tax=Corallococcus aberystwythensis TaxID=2316722 RepID=A0A3A8R7F1_9BACT|nr:DUF6348 family protein [Corallococcus aberystwythensis]RKH74775.1 hypothetical protein D7W81_00165 [Corallococcus aberystwythensis]